MEPKYIWAYYIETTLKPQVIAASDKSIKTHILEIITWKIKN